MATLAEKAILEEDKHLIQQVWERLEHPSEIRCYDLEFGSDHAGDPAVWIFLEWDKDANPSLDLVADLTPFSRRFSASLLEAGLHHWPFVTFSAWRRQP
jgi:hypothetical protein